MLVVNYTFKMIKEATDSWKMNKDLILYRTAKELYILRFNSPPTLRLYCIFNGPLSPKRQKDVFHSTN